MKNNLAENQMQFIKGVLDSEDTIKLAIIYGSFAAGIVRENSDTDIAIAGREVSSPDKLAELNLKLAEIIGQEIDIVDLNVTDGTLFKEVLTKGRLIKNRDHTVFTAYY